MKYARHEAHRESISDVLTRDHRRCDELFAAAEAAAARGDLPKSAEGFAAFRACLERHIRIEEEMLFPAFEAASGQHAGPTAVMRTEHAMIHGLLREMNEALQSGRTERYLDASETLLVLMQQHNLKEEQILYRLVERVLDPEAEALHARIAAALRES